MSVLLLPTETVGVLQLLGGIGIAADGNLRRYVGRHRGHRQDR